MKYLLLLLCLMGLVFLSGVRKGRSGSGQGGREQDAPPRDQAASPKAAMMVACAECGAHLPQSEAYPGKGGQFCSAEHRASFEAREGHG